MELDLETVGYLSEELSGFFAHVAKALAQKRSTGSLPPSLFNGSTTAPVSVKNGRKSKKVKSTRAPRAVSAYNQFMKEKFAELHNGDLSGQSHKARFEEAAKMWSSMSEEAKRAYTEDFKARVARGEISAVSARVTAEAAAAAAPDAAASPPEDDAAAPSPKKKKKRKDAGEATDEVFAQPPADADAGAAFQRAADVPQGEKKKKKKKKKHLEAAAAAAEP